MGWCCLDDLTPVEEVWALSEGVRVPCLTEVPRPDVARLLGSSALENAGFVCRIPLAGSAARVTLVARVANADHPIGDFPVEWSAASAAPHSGPEYAAWLATHEPRLYWPAEEVEQRLPRLESKPVFSVILPTFNTHLYHLQRCIDSVTSQHYPHWELCITDDKSSDPRVRQYLLERAAGEPRIRLAFAEQQGGISAASNRSVEDCTGDFIVLLDHDDELHPSALLEVARCLNEYPETDLVYSDEDKIDQVGSRCCPAFKPDFDEDLLCGFDYLGPPGCDTNGGGTTGGRVSIGGRRGPGLGPPPARHVSHLPRSRPARAKTPVPLANARGLHGLQPGCQAVCRPGVEPRARATRRASPLPLRGKACSTAR